MRMPAFAIFCMGLRPDFRRYDLRLRLNVRFLKEVYLFGINKIIKPYLKIIKTPKFKRDRKAHSVRFPTYRMG